MLCFVLLCRPASSLSDKSSYETATPNSREVIDKAWDFANEGKIGEARALLDRALEERPHSPYALMVLGYLYLAEGKLDEAQKEFERVITNIQTRQEEPDPFFQKVSSWSYLGLGTVQMGLGDYFKAEQALMKAMHLFPNPAPYSLLGVLARKYENDLSLSESIHREILEKYPDFFSNGIYLAVVYLEQGKKELAEKLVREVKNEKGYELELAAYYSVSGHTDKSLDYFQRYLDRYRQFPSKIQQIFKQIEKDEDFENLRKTPQFQRLVRDLNVSSFQAKSRPPL